MKIKEKLAAALAVAVGEGGIDVHESDAIWAAFTGLVQPAAASRRLLEVSTRYMLGISDLQPDPVEMAKTMVALDRALEKAAS